MKKLVKKGGRSVVLSVGGSIIVDQKINTQFLKEFKKIILKFIGHGHRIAMVAGGGNICRKYNEAALKVTHVNHLNLDWLGITATKLNAELLRVIFLPHSGKKVIYNPTKKITTQKKVLVGSGWRPGCSSDKDAVLLAINLGAKTVINISNIDYVYDKNPHDYPDAKKIEAIDWDGFLKITGETWHPGMHVPFDPEASKLCRKNNIAVIILNGSNLANLEKALHGEKFKGTTISN